MAPFLQAPHLDFTSLPLQSSTFIAAKYCSYVEVAERREAVTLSWCTGCVTASVTAKVSWDGGIRREFISGRIVSP